MGQVHSSCSLGGSVGNGLDSQAPDYHEIGFRDYIHRTGSTADKEDQGNSVLQPKRRNEKLVIRE